MFLLKRYVLIISAGAAICVNANELPISDDTAGETPSPRRFNALETPRGSGGIVSMGDMLALSPTTQAASVASPSRQSGIARTTSLDGRWYDTESRLGFRISGSIGTATDSITPKIKPGDEVLRFSSTSPLAIRGRLLAADGRWYAVTGAVNFDGQMHLAAGERRWTMVRQTNATIGPVLADQNPIMRAAPQHEQTPPSQVVPDDFVNIANTVASEIAIWAQKELAIQISVLTVSRMIVEVGSRLPKTVVKQLSLNPRGWVGWTAKILEREVGRELLKKVDPLGFALGVASEVMVEVVRENWPANHMLNFAGTPFEGWTRELAVFAIRESTVGYAVSVGGVPAAIAAQFMVSGGTLVEAAKAGIDLRSERKAATDAGQLAAAADRFLRLRTDFRSSSDPAQKMDRLRRIAEFLDGDGNILVRQFRDPEAQKHMYICNLAAVGGTSCQDVLAGPKDPKNELKATPFVRQADVRALSSPPDQLTQIDPCLLYKCGGSPVRILVTVPALAEPRAKAPQVGTVQKGARLTPVDAAFVTLKPEISRVNARRQSSDYPRHYYEPGDRIYHYTDWGEGCYTVWTKGFLYGYFEPGKRPGYKSDITCFINDWGDESLQSGEFERWIKVPITKDRSGWIRLTEDNHEFVE